jgi:hypothetical protein
MCDSSHVRPNFRHFLSALLGTKLSLALFESIDDPKTGELSWRLRHSRPNFDIRSRATAAQPSTVDDLKTTLQILRDEVARLEAENTGLNGLIDRMKLALPNDLRETFEQCRKIYGLIDQAGSSLKDAEADIAALVAKLPTSV